MARLLINRVLEPATRRPGLRRKAIAASAGAAVLLVGLVIASLAGPAAVAASPLAVTVRLTDRGCSVPRVVRAPSLLIRVVNRGRYVHTFTIARRRSSPPPGTTKVLHVRFPRAGRYAYTCSRHGRSLERGRLSVLAVPTAAKPCGVAPKPPAVYQHVVWIVLENKSWHDVMGSAYAPNTRRIAGLCGAASEFYGEAHPSLPNYVAMTSGGTQGITDDSGPGSHKLSVDSIFQQAGSWRALEESMPANCSTSDTTDYAVRHNPALYYLGLHASCPVRDVPLGAKPNLAAKFTFVTPNTCHDMHSSPCGSTTNDEVRAGDTWLASFLRQVIATPQYRSDTTAVIVTWDESSHGDPATQRIPTLVIAPSVRPGTLATTRFDHYSLLRTTEQLLGLRTFLGAAASAPSMRGAFHF
ncbi:MAG TPA: alkaline phosphatase family protein [Gaiellaceae bacterium]|nr:alkaline phosphatase family protein [Gaiellaceae bacterium]